MLVATFRPEPNFVRSTSKWSQNTGTSPSLLGHQEHPSSLNPSPEGSAHPLSSDSAKANKRGPRSASRPGAPHGPQDGSGHTWDGPHQGRNAESSQGQDPTWPICVLPVHSSRLNCHAPAPPPATTTNKPATLSGPHFTGPGEVSKGQPQAQRGSDWPGPHSYWCQGKTGTHPLTSACGLLGKSNSCHMSLLKTCRVLGRVGLRHLLG